MHDLQGRPRRPCKIVPPFVTLLAADLGVRDTTALRIRTAVTLRRAISRSPAAIFVKHSSRNRFVRNVFEGTRVDDRCAPPENSPVTSEARGGQEPTGNVVTRADRGCFDDPFRASPVARRFRRRARP